jgi:putative nucleotidyltransferase with HDIG domain
MRYASRTFLWSIVPFTILLIGIFWAVQQSVSATVRKGLRTSLRENQVAVANMQRRAEVQKGRSLRAVAESAALKAGLQLLLADEKSIDARLTVEDQLREICDSIGVDFLLVSSVEGAPLVGVMRDGDHLTAMDAARIQAPVREFLLRNGRVYRVTSVPIDQAEENIALLSVGEHFDLSDFNAPMVLLNNGKVIKSSLAGFSLNDIQSGLAVCQSQTECELKLGDETYLSLSLENLHFGNGYALRSLQSVDRAVSPVQHVLRQIFVNSGLCALLAAIILSALSARSIVKPIAQLVLQLRRSANSGLLPQFDNCKSPVWEIQELTTSFNEASVAIRQGRDALNGAYLQFIGSLASALDARDPYTAGHSIRVSEYSYAIAKDLGLPEAQLEEVRIGALLHDIGKIGISDLVLQKPGRLTSDEFDLIKQHPVIGRKILEGVHGLAAYLPIVELHHENSDGSGYPYGLREGETPLGARIVHVADAYDAMTSDRPYRRGMSSGIAVETLKRNAGTQFDATVVDSLEKCLECGEAPSLEAVSQSGNDDSLRSLAIAVAGEIVRAGEQFVARHPS